MNFKKFLSLAKESGIEECEIVGNKSASLSFSLFHGELDNYSSSSSTSFIARGIYKGKMGLVRTEKDEKDSPKELVEAIKKNSQLIEKKEEPIIFEGSKKYSRKNVYSKALEEWDTKDKLEKLHKLEDLLKSLDSRVTEVEVSYSESSSESQLANSHGLNLKNKSNYFYFYGSVVVKEGEEVKSGGDMFLDSDPSKFDLEKFAKKIVDEAVSQLHATPIGKARKTKVVLNPDCVSSLLSALLSNLSAESIQKHTSLMEGKLNEQVVSKKISVDEKPLTKNCFFQYFDDEGVACFDKKVIDHGKLLTYFYNLETAKKDGVESTGNAARMGGKMGIAFNNIVLKPGKLSEDQLFEKVKDGIYLTDINGLHAGLNAQSGDFSLQSAGFLIKDGKKSEALELFTVAGNLYKLFNDVLAVGSNSKLTLSSVSCPSIAVKNLKVSG